MLTDLCMLDELAVRLRVQGGMRWRPGTATRLGRTRSVIRSLLAPCSALIFLPSIVMRGNRRCWMKYRSNHRLEESAALPCFCQLHSGNMMEPLEHHRQVCSTQTSEASPPNIPI